MRKFNGFLASITVISLGTAIPLNAEEILIRANSDQSDGYSEPDGQWTDAPISSALPGLPAGNARALAKEAGTAYTGTALFTLKPATSGQAFLDITWPDGVNSPDTSVLVMTPSDSKLILVDMDPSNSDLANQWVRLDTVTTSENEEIRVVIQPSEDATANESSLLMVDSIRLTSENTALTDPDAVTVTTADTAMDLATGTATGADRDALRQSNIDDPFAVAEELEIQDPFQGGATSTDNIDNPFEGETESAPAEMAGNPFEAIDDSSSPAQASSGSSDDPFAVEESGASNPFEESRGTEIAVDDPFGATTTSPFAGTSEGAASTQTNPFGGAATAQSSPSRNVITSEPNDIDLDNLFADLESSNVTDAFLAPSSVSIDMEGLDQPMTVANRKEVEPLIFNDTVEAAQVSAKNYGRNILVLFTGDSTRAAEFENALEDPELSELLSNFELVKLPYASNRAKAREYAVNSFPYLVVISSQGFTKGHVVPTTSIDRLKSSLSEYTNSYL